MKPIYVLAATAGILIGFILGPIIGMHIAMEKFYHSQQLATEDIKHVDERLGRIIDQRFSANNTMESLLYQRQQFMQTILSQNVKYKSQRDYYVQVLGSKKIISQDEMWKVLLESDN